MARLLGLDLAPSAVQKGYDAKDAQGRRDQIKARRVRAAGEATSFDFRGGELDFDVFVGVLLSPELEVLRVVRLPHAAVAALARQTEGGSGRAGAARRPPTRAWRPP